MFFTCSQIFHTVSWWSAVLNSLSPLKNSSCQCVSITNLIAYSYALNQSSILHWSANPGNVQHACHPENESLGIPLPQAKIKCHHQYVFQLCKIQGMTNRWFTDRLLYQCLIISIAFLAHAYRNASSRNLLSGLSSVPSLQCLHRSRQIFQYISQF